MNEIAVSMSSDIKNGVSSSESNLKNSLFSIENLLLLNNNNNKNRSNRNSSSDDNSTKSDDPGAMNDSLEVKKSSDKDDDNDEVEVEDEEEDFRANQKNANALNLPPFSSALSSCSTASSCSSSAASSSNSKYHNQPLPQSAQGLIGANFLKEWQSLFANHNNQFLNPALFAKFASALNTPPHNNPFFMNHSPQLNLSNSFRHTQSNTTPSSNTTFIANDNNNSSGLGSGFFGGGSHHPPHGILVKPKKKRSRAAFSHAQVLELEKKFNNQRYLSGPERADLAASLKVRLYYLKIFIGH
jgi:hypothetical protein